MAATVTATTTNAAVSRSLGPAAAAAVAAARMDPLDALLLVTLLGGDGAPADDAAIVERCAALAAGGDSYALFERAMHPSGAARWEAFCAAAERCVRGDDPNDPVAVAAAEASAATQRAGIFGRCRRCGSKRLLVTTKQLRRADEGMTELRQCQDCGHVSRSNS